MIKKFIMVIICAMMLGLGLFGQTASAGVGTPTSRSFGINYGPAAQDLFIVATATSTGTLTEAGYVAGYTDSSSTPTTLICREETTAALIVGLSLTNQMSISFMVKKGDYWRVDATATQNYLYEYQITYPEGAAIDPVSISLTPEDANPGDTISIRIKECYLNATSILNNEGNTEVHIRTPDGYEIVSGGIPTEINYGCYYYLYVVPQVYAGNSTDIPDGNWQVYVISNISGKWYSDISGFYDPDYSIDEAMRDAVSAFSNQSTAIADAIMYQGNTTADAMNNISDAITGQTFAYDIEEALREIANISLGGGGSCGSGCYPYRDVSETLIPLKLWVQSGLSKYVEFDIYYRLPIYANQSTSISWNTIDSGGDIAYVSNMSIYLLNTTTLAKTYIQGVNVPSDFRAMTITFPLPADYLVNITIKANAYTTYRQIAFTVRDDAEIRCTSGNGTSGTTETENTTLYIALLSVFFLMVIMSYAFQNAVIFGMFASMLGGIIVFTHNNHDFNLAILLISAWVAWDRGHRIFEAYKRHKEENKQEGE